MRPLHAFLDDLLSQTVQQTSQVTQLLDVLENTPAVLAAHQPKEKDAPPTKRQKKGLQPLPPDAIAAMTFFQTIGAPLPQLPGYLPLGAAPAKKQHKQTHQQRAALPPHTT